MKKISAILLILLISLSSCTNEYIEYHKEEFGYKSETKNAAISNADFKVEDIGYRDFDLFITPDKKSLDYLVSKIDNAKERVYLTVYILTEKRIIKALKDARSR
jgi:phosphatidylserine/phosphatidylglycerophosphate/cardiolipin synthase-like enzyme